MEIYLNMFHAIVKNWILPDIGDTNIVIIDGRDVLGWKA